MDFLAYVDNSVEGVVTIARNIIAVEVAEDGLVFDPVSGEAQRIKEDADYEGVRIHFSGLPFLAVSVPDLLPHDLVLRFGVF